MMVIVCTGSTEQEAREKAEKMIKEMDYMRQPQLGAVYQHVSGEWKATVQYWGLD